MISGGRRPTHDIVVSKLEELKCFRGFEVISSVPRYFLYLSRFLDILYLVSEIVERFMSYLNYIY